MERPDLKIDAEDAGTSLVMKGAHPDYKIIVPQTEDNKSGQIKIDQIRELLPFMMHKPARGGWRVAIIDSMDDVNLNGANALTQTAGRTARASCYISNCLAYWAFAAHNPVTMPSCADDKIGT